MSRVVLDRSAFSVKKTSSEGIQSVVVRQETSRKKKGGFAVSSGHLRVATAASDSPAEKRLRKTTGNEGGGPPLAENTLSANVGTSSNLSKDKTRPELSDPNVSLESRRTAFTAINSFSGIYDFLNNDTPCDVWFNGTKYFSASHAILIAQYVLSPEQVTFVTSCPDIKSVRHQLSKEEQQITEKPDWLQIRLKYVEQIVRDKFRRSTDFQRKLSDTGGRSLIWGNKYDAFFGQIDLKGQNHLGRILTNIRGDLKDGIELETWLACCFDLEPDDAARPAVNLLEVKTGENNQKHHLLVGHPFFRMGKLPDNEVVAINPSVSRRHAVIGVLKGGTIAFIDLRSKSLSYINGSPVKDDHVPVLLHTGDIVSLGTSSRMYHVKIDTSRVVEYYEKRQRDLRREIQRLDSSDPLASFGLTDNPRVLIGNLPFHTTVDEIQDFFAACGSIKDVVFSTKWQQAEFRCRTACNKGDGVHYI